MDRTNIINVSFVEGKKIAAYNGFVFAIADSYDKMVSEIVDQGNNVNANMVINFQVNISGMFYGQGTAVTVE